MFLWILNLFKKFFTKPKDTLTNVKYISCGYPTKLTKKGDLK